MLVLFWVVGAEDIFRDGYGVWEGKEGLSKLDATYV